MTAVKCCGRTLSFPEVVAVEASVSTLCDYRRRGLCAGCSVPERDVTACGVPEVRSKHAYPRRYEEVRISFTLRPP